MDSKVFDFLLEHDHGKIQVRNVPSMHSIRQRVYMIYRERFTSWEVTRKETKERRSDH